MDVPQMIMDFSVAKTSDDLKMKGAWEGLHEFQSHKTTAGKNKFDLKVLVQKFFIF